MMGSSPHIGEISQIPATKLYVGSVAVPNRVILAPMSGITDAPFRRAAERLGAGLVVSEMTACAGLAQGQREASVRSRGQGVAINVVQLAGCETHWMAEGARIVEGQGAQIIDINMGCPSKQVTNGASGSALMRDLDHALTLIDACSRRVAAPELEWVGTPLRNLGGAGARALKVTVRNDLDWFGVAGGIGCPTATWERPVK